MIPTPPIGFRILNAGEKTQTGDLFYAHGAWLDVAVTVRQVQKWSAVFYARKTGTGGRVAK